MPRLFSPSDVRQLAGVAAEAGRLILDIRREHLSKVNDMQARAKDDGSPVTRADHAAQEHILERITRLGLEGTVIAEETAENASVSGAKGYYLIDPLDGTRAFVGGGDDFTVNIGYIAGGAPSMGVLHVPALNETYYSDGQKAYFIGSGNEEEIQARIPNPIAGYDIIVNRTEDWSGRLKTYLANYSVRELHRRSSAHKLGLVAHGKYDLYPRFGPTYEWDIAAGDAILRAAGGAVRTLDGAALTYGKENFLNPAFIASGRPLAA
jgi:3'(2'), 5'-bisphosphate nucleotidase